VPFFISLVRLLRRVEDLAIALLLGIISVAVFLGVFFRYLLRDPLIWSEELSLICFAWLIFIGAAICSRQKKHMSIDTFTSLLPSKAIPILDRWTRYLMMLITGILIYFGFRHAIYAYPTQTTALGLSWTYVFLSVPVGSCLILIHLLHEILEPRPDSSSIEASGGTAFSPPSEEKKERIIGGERA
jgi:TRAP-type transport system small permease protein